MVDAVKARSWHIRDRKIKLALVGLGRIAKTHLDAIKQHANDLELVAVCDQNKDMLKKISHEFQAQAYTDLTTCLQETDADIVVLCTPSGLHPSQTILAADAGKHVITEKPMATKWQDGLDMLSACEENAVQLLVVKQNRFNKPLQLLHKAIQEQRFGKIYMSTINVFWARQQSYYAQGDWRGTWRMDGGAFMNQASHYFDLVHWLLGPVQSVYSMNATLARNIEAEDTGVVALKWRSGALGTMNITVLTYPQDREGSITILGEKGSVKIGGVALNTIETWDFADEHPMDAEVTNASYTTESVYGFGHMDYYQNMIEYFRGNAKAMTTGYDGLKSLELLVAAYTSARDNMPMNLPLNI